MTDRFPGAASAGKAQMIPLPLFPGHLSQMQGVAHAGSSHLRAFQESRTAIVEKNVDVDYLEKAGGRAPKTDKLLKPQGKRRGVSTRDPLNPRQFPLSHKHVRGSEKGSHSRRLRTEPGSQRVG